MDGRAAQAVAHERRPAHGGGYLAAGSSRTVFQRKQVNELLNEWHTFEDWAPAARVMFDWGYLNRESDGSKYWLRPGRDSCPAPRVRRHQPGLVGGAEAPSPLPLGLGLLDLRG
jgi:hypothetical protein